MTEKPFDEVVKEALHLLEKYFHSQSVVWLIVTLFLLANIIRIILVTFVVSRSRKRESFYFQMLGFAILFWTLGTLMVHLPPYLPPNLASNNFVRFYAGYIGTIGMVFVPPTLCLHIWKQVSYKDIRWYTNLLYFTPSFLFAATIVRDLLAADTSQPLTLWISYGIGRMLCYAFFILPILRAYLMMFNVFYQMPPHMRKSTHHILVGVSFMVMSEFIQLGLPNLPPYNFLLFGTHIMLDYLYASFSIASANNVIVTSREFAFNSLSTMVIILSEKQNILDWNRKDSYSEFLLPVPHYKEPFENYYQRIIEEGNGVVSSHDKNIISTTREGKEGHYLITTHLVQRRNRKFGYLVEISEVTKIYTVFRYLEEIATKDQLTGLFNRNAYLDKVKTIIDPQHLPLLIMVGDVNNLKPINDIYGHLEGDNLLTTATRAIKDHLPPNAFAARIGGDEFVMLVPQGNEQMAETFIADVNKNCAVHSKDTRFTLSISWGYSLITNEKEHYNDVFKKADTMMYERKKIHHRAHSSGSIPEARNL